MGLEFCGTIRLGAWRLASPRFHDSTESWSPRELRAWTSWEPEYRGTVDFEAPEASGLRSDGLASLWDSGADPLMVVGPFPRDFRGLGRTRVALERGRGGVTIYFTPNGPKKGPWLYRDSKFAGEVGVLESPDKPMPIGMALGEGWRDDGATTWKLTVHGARA